jgi:hypothetical protein
MEIKLTSPNGIILKTAGKQCEEDITVIPELETAGGGDNLLDAFMNGSLTEAVLPNATKIKAYAFQQDRSLVNISMPKVMIIGNNAFYQCYKLAITELPSGLTSIGNSAFRECIGITITELPSGLTSIGTNAFFGCSGIKSITFKGTLSSLNSNTFINCTNIKTINVPWAEGAVSGAPWGANSATINYNYTGE